MHETSSQGVGLNRQAAAKGHDAPEGPDGSVQTRPFEPDRPGHRGYYTYRAGEGIVFVPYGLSPSAK